MSFWLKTVLASILLVIVVFVASLPMWVFGVVATLMLIGALFLSHERHAWAFSRRQTKRHKEFARRREPRLTTDLPRPEYKTAEK